MIGNDIDWSKPLNQDEDIDWSKPINPSGEQRMLSEVATKDAKVKEPFLERLMKSLENFGQEQSRGYHAQNAFTLGAAQQLGEMGANTANILPGVNIPKPNFQESLQDENLNPIFSTGRLAAGIPAELGAFGLARKIPWLAGANPLKSIGAGALTGALTGGEDAIERLLGGLLGTTAGIGSQIPRITNKGVGEKIVRTADELSSKFKKEFDNIFNTAENLGINKVTRKGITPSLMKDYSRIVTKKEKASLSDFMQNPTPKNAHKAQSDISSAIRRLEEQPRNNAVTAAINAGEEMKNNLLKSIDRQFEHKGVKNLGDKYKKARYDYREEMVPYLNTRAIRNARKKPSEKGYIEPNYLPSELGGKSGSGFRQTKAKEHPELMINRLLAGPIGKGLGTALGLGTLGPIAYETLRKR